MTQTIWTESETQKLIELRNNGAGSSSIAEELGRTKDSVRYRMRWLDAQGKEKPLTKEKLLSMRPTRTENSPQDNEAKPLRKKENYHVSYPPLEWCPTCHSPVSNWTDHASRMSHMGCQRPCDWERSSSNVEKEHELQSRQVFRRREDDLPYE